MLVKLNCFRETLMSKLEMYDIQKKHYEVWIELYHKYAEYYQVDIPKDNFDLTWKWLTSENYPFWGILADVDSKIVGFAHFRSLPSPLDSCEVGFLDDLFVLQEYRGKKIGYSLIEKVHQIGKSKNWPYINWITKDDNYTARTLYDKISTKTDWNFYELTVKS
jgi:GNAT superfamily N-acetyltransferase